ncbi:methenyl tetrahydrofolate cyclohydrolase [Desulfosporosinus acidiphilus SJ4]|uniref:Methenyl tetrahydrofolate cyclohydrolase n=1 Tax=Desulfosporosinus acidiphilus (strain DSM 22704 / JCM 16185 / SJ4) TaxID=646529 RepID=I4DBB1_DESAJ|nr:cyclodeaminase/cyclohydrolase family protein [Desulfosporosinus acidiphilus]AFM43085.1 methenyl tetrahydrofolate cyclohydrolase [Desulfosporosinus acidiphilus SJ4]
MDLKDMSLREFGLEVASSSPAPGGGSVAAYAGVQGFALAAMVCRLTLGREKFSAVQDEMQSLLDMAEKKQEILLALVDEDTEGFKAVMGALGLPKTSDEEKVLRREALEGATMKAADIPMHTARECLAGLRVLPGLLDKGNPNALSDMGVASLMFKSGLEGALYNVQINALGLKSQAKKEDLLAECQRLRDEGNALFAECQEKVLKGLK